MSLVLQRLRNKRSKSPSGHASLATAKAQREATPTTTASQQTTPTAEPGRLDVLDSQGYSNKLFWPKELLPSTLPNVCIYSWGYDADIGKFMSSAGLNTLYRHAQNLLNDLATLQESKKDHPLPLIFVAHSLGGLVVKDALNQSTETGNKRLKEIVSATLGICFLGTPHRGSQSASLGRKLFRITEVIAAQRANTQLLQTLEKNSDTLERITKSFYETLRTHERLHIFSFCEEKEVRKLGFLSAVIVYPDSAQVGYGNEEIGSIPANHSDMVRFGSAKDPGFIKVAGVLKRWVNEIQDESILAPSPEYRGCLSSLNSRIARDRITQVSMRHKDSFEWLYDSKAVPFRTWLTNSAYNQPIFWVTGKPGSGKSTLMRFAMQDPRTQAYLKENQNDNNSWHFIGFFFHERGSAIQKTIEGLLKELLFQVLNQFPHLFGIMKSHYARLITEQRKHLPDWDERTLKICLYDVLDCDKHTSDSLSMKICFFIDALDEHIGDNNQLLSIIELLARLSQQNSSRVSNKIRFKICLASRPWTVFMERFAALPQFAIHKHTSVDIVNYANEKLNQALQSRTNEVQSNLQMWKSLVDSITDKALGVFIWVRIVVDEVCNGIRDGTAYFLLKELVLSMPAELKDLYAHTLQRVDPQHVFEAHTMLQIALCALSPLPLSIFWDCTMAALYEETAETANLTDPLSWLASRSGGLLEAVQQSSPPPDRHHLPPVHIATENASESMRRTRSLSSVSVDTGRTSSLRDSLRYGAVPGTTAETTAEPELMVQFIHQTVKDYVRNGILGLRYIHGYDVLPQRARTLIQDPTVYIKKTGNVLIFNACRFLDPANLGMQALRESFLSYAVAIDQEVDEGKSESSDLLPLRFISTLERWIPRSFPPYVYEFGHKLSPLLVAICVNLYNYPGHHFLYEIRFDTDNSSLLHIATLAPPIFPHRSNRTRMVRTILDWKVAVDSKFTIASLFMTGLDVEFFDDMLRYKESSISTPLGALIMTKAGTIDETTRISVAKVLLQNGADPNHESFYKGIGMPAMEICARYHTIEWIKLLHTYGARWHVPYHTHVALLTSDNPARGHYHRVWSAIEDEGIKREPKDDHVIHEDLAESGFMLPSQPITPPMRGIMTAGLIAGAIGGGAIGGENVLMRS